MARRVLSILITVVFAVGLVPVGAMATVPVRTIDGEFPVSTAPGGQVQPDIDWPWVVYKDGRYDEGEGGEPHIRLYNMETGKDFAVSSENVGLWEQSNPSVSGNRVVYSDQRDYDETECDIWMYDISAGEESVVCNAANGQGNPYIYEDIVAWIDRRYEATQSTDIYMKDLATGEESAVCTDTSWAYEPVVWEDYIVWRDGRLGTSSIYMRDLVSGEETCVAAGITLLNDYTYRNDPFVGDGKVVWQSYRQWYNGVTWQYERYIDMYDIASGETTTLSTVTGPGNRWHPVVRDGFVVWADSRNSYQEVWGYDLASEEETIVVAAAEDGSIYAGRATVGQGVVLWHDHRDGDGDDSDSDLYAKFLGDESAPTQNMPLQGVDRYATAAQVSAQSFPDGADLAVIATGENWPDALAGSALAGAYDAPILLVGDASKDGLAEELPDVVADEIERLGAQNVFLLGGEQAISADVEDALESLLGTDTVRFAGADRYETACIIASATVDALVAMDAWSGDAFVTTGRNFPDALAAAPLAAWSGRPIFLADEGGLSDATEACMDDLGVTDAVVLGGTVAVPMMVMSDLQAAGVTEVDRVGGATRYETAALVAEWGVNNLGMSFDTIGMATGTNFPDALSLGAGLGQDGFPLLMTPGTNLHEATEAALIAHRGEISQVRFAGGPWAIAPSVRFDIMAALY